MSRFRILGVSVPSDSCIQFADSCRNYGVAAHEDVWLDTVLYKCTHGDSTGSCFLPYWSEELLGLNPLKKSAAPFRAGQVGVSKEPTPWLLAPPQRFGFLGDFMRYAFPSIGDTNPMVELMKKNIRRKKW